MTTRLRAQIVSIGDSPAIRLPVPVLEQSGLGPEVELEVRRNQIVIQSPSPPHHDPGDVSTHDEITSLYAELGDLMARSDDETGLEEAIETRFRKLRQLQTAEADAMQAAFESQRHLAPGRGWRALERAREILGDEDPSFVDKAADS